MSVSLAERMLVKFHRRAADARAAGRTAYAKEQLLLAALVCEQLPVSVRSFELAHVESKLSALTEAA